MKMLTAMLLLPIVANAQPGPVMQYLMTERASLLDVGMMRLATLTAEFEKRVGLHWTDNGEAKLFRAEINSSYDPQDDKIYVTFSMMDSGPTEAQMTEGCRNAMAQMNIWLTKSLPGLFLHTGYDDPSAPPDLFRSLAGMFELRCYFSSSRSSAEGRFWASRTLGILGDSEMRIGKWTMRAGPTPRSTSSR